MQVLPECCYRYMESSQWDVSIATFKQYLHPIVNFPCIYSNIQAVPASHCELSVYVLQHSGSTCIGKFTMGCRYCLNVAIHTRKVYNGMQVLPECCYRYMESLQWDVGTA
jgi:hypothetical protein